MLWIRKLVLPAVESYQNRQSEKCTENEMYTIASEYNLELREDNLQLSGHTLSSMILSRDHSFTCNKYIIFFNGNNSFFELRHRFIEYCKIAKQLDIQAVIFNYRGVGKSTGDVKNAICLKEDGIAMVDNLLSKGVPPENIILFGHSLGGGVASVVAEHFFDKGLHLSLFNSRSFSTLTYAATYLFPASVKMKITLNRNNSKFYNLFFGNRVISKCITFLKNIIYIYPTYYFIKFVFKYTDWEIDALSAYKKIPFERKSGIIVYSHPNEMNENTYVDDEVIAAEASMVKGMVSLDDIDNNVDKTKIERVRAIQYYIGGHDASYQDLVSAVDGKKTAEKIIIDFFAERLNLFN